MILDASAAIRRAVIVVAAAAAIVGDNVGYWIGRTRRPRAARALGAARRYAEKLLPPAERFFEQHGGKTVFIGRFVAVLRVDGRVARGHHAHGVVAVPRLERRRRHLLGDRRRPLAYYGGKAAAERSPYGLLGAAATSSSRAGRRRRRILGQAAGIETRLEGSRRPRRNLVRPWGLPSLSPRLEAATRTRGPLARVSRAGRARRALRLGCDEPSASRAPPRRRRCTTSASSRVAGGPATSRARSTADELDEMRAHPEIGARMVCARPRAPRGAPVRALPPRALGRRRLPDRPRRRRRSRSRPASSPSWTPTTR